MSVAVRQPWFRRGLLVLLALVILAPAFGWAAAQVGYAEPLEHAAAVTGASEHGETINPGLFPDYKVPGLGAASGTFVSAVVGTLLTLALATGLGRALADG